MNDAMTELGRDADELLDDLSLDPLACPGVFYPTLAADGVLSRIRTPGGLLTSEQARLIAEIAESFADSRALVTNRANFQLRALATQLPGDVLVRLQRSGLASMEPRTDHLRNLMGSPAAGLDADAAVDTRPLVRAFDAYLAAHPEVAGLPAKFSIGFDGGEHASIAVQPNDVLFRAYRTSDGMVRFRVVVRVGGGDGESLDVGLAIESERVQQIAVTIAQWYLDALPANGSKPRLRHLFSNLDARAIREQIFDRASELRTDDEALPMPAAVGPRAPVGVHAQPEADLAYVGLTPFLNGLSSRQLRVLADCADGHGSGTLRLSPWRNVLIPDVPLSEVEALQGVLDAAGLPSRATSFASQIVTCAGSAGCGSGHADTIRDAQLLGERLGSTASGRTIHITGCAKCCAQRRPADFTLLAVAGADEQYEIYREGATNARLGDFLVGPLPAAAAIEWVAALAADG